MVVLNLKWWLDVKWNFSWCRKYIMRKVDLIIMCSLWNFVVMKNVDLYILFEIVNGVL